MTEDQKRHARTVARGARAVLSSAPESRAISSMLIGDHTTDSNDTADRAGLQARSTRSSATPSPQHARRPLHHVRSERRAPQPAAREGDSMTLPPLIPRTLLF